jgi:curved DNA-binding protein CbpA
MGESFYDVLDVGRDASQADIESAYRERVKETHPDLNDSPDAADAFQRVQTAEEVLGDPDERARYDRLGHASYTSHFGASPAEDGSGWDFGSDRSAEEARDGGGEGRWGRDGGGRDGGGRDGGGRDGGGRDGGGRDGRTSGGSVGDDGFGFDPGAYDRTRERQSDGNPTERSYDVSGGDDRDDAADDGLNDDLGDGATATANAGAGSATDGATSTANGGTGRAKASTAAGAGASATADWQEQARRSKREWSKATQREGRGSIDDDPGGYSVHDWNDDELERETTRYSLQGSEFVVVAITFVLYPFMAYSTITPAFPMFVNAVVGLCALALTGYLLTMPRIGFLVFGAWSVLVPTVYLAVPGLELVSLVGFVVLGTTWIPFAYSILFLHVVD